MYPYIVCTSCGREIGCLYTMFCEMRRDLFVSEFGDIDIDPALIPLTQDFQVELGSILDSMGLTMSCCRTKMISQVEFKELY